jgi:hypothetical protein
MSFKLSTYILVLSAFVILLCTQVVDAAENNKAPKCFKKGELYLAQTLDNGGPPGSGGIDPNAIPCCGNLEERNSISYCGMGIAGGKAEMVCIACGDGKCEKTYENHCNCPEDCK